MQKLILALCVATLLGCLFWLFQPGDQRDAASPRAAAPAEAEPAVGLASPEASAQPPAEAEARVLLASDPPLAPEAPSAQVAPRSRVLGRVADQRGMPLEGAEVRLRSVGSPWLGEEVHAEEAPASYAVSTGRDGHFAFDVLTPRTDWVALSITAGIYHGKAVRHFGLAGGRNETSLSAGENDLGTFVLEDAGAVTGRVTDSSGRPLPGADVTLETQSSATASARTDEGGLYELGGLPAAFCTLKASHESGLSAARAGVEVRLGETTHAVDFELSTAPTLHGRVADEAGAPLAGVRIWGWPASSGRGAGARSGDDGSFVVQLPQEEPYTLGAKLTGYEDLPALGSVTHQPGARDIVLVLKRPVLHAFHVRDSVTGTPVQRFGMKLIQVRTEQGGTMGSSAHREPEPLGDHPGGVVELAGDPALCDYVIEAPGYAAQRGAVALDGEGKQVITLLPEASLAGRLMLGGEPVPEPLVRLEADLLPDEDKVAGARERGTFGDVPPDDESFTSHRDLDEFAGRTRLERGGADGGFRFGGLAPGTYELVLSGAGAAPLKLERLVLKAGEARDLGTLAADAPGELAGVLLLPTDAARGGLRVALGDGWLPDWDDAQVTDHNGTFRFGGLGAGVHRIFVEPKPGVLMAGPPFEFELGPGESRSVELDLAPRVPCRVSIRARLSGPALDGVRAVAVRPTRDGQQFEDIGTLDAQGRLEGFITGGEILAFELRGPSQAVLASDAGPRRVDPGGSVELEFQAQLGSLVAVMPADPDAGKLQHLMVSLRPAGGVWTGGTPKWREVDEMVHVDLGAVLPGEYELQVWRNGGAAWTATATVQAGLTSSVTLRSP